MHVRTLPDFLLEMVGNNHEQHSDKWKEEQQKKKLDRDIRQQLIKHKHNKEQQQEQQCEQHLQRERHRDAIHAPQRAQPKAQAVSFSFTSPPPCPYGADCFRVSNIHRQQFSHPGDIDTKTEHKQPTNMEEEEEDKESQPAANAQPTHRAEKRQHRSTSQAGQREHDAAAAAADKDSSVSAYGRPCAKVDYKEEEDEDEDEDEAMGRRKKQRVTKHHHISESADDDEGEAEYTLNEDEQQSAMTVDDDVDAVEQKKQKPLCRYGASCYRKNPAHFVEFRH